jgi:hypothetical protein
MIQLGCCDFNLKNNMKNENININNLNIYNPKELALGAYGNIYNINFAKIIYYEKIHVFKEFDTNFAMYYNKYNIGICYPNLITAELSTTNLNHNYSLFKECKHLNYNNYYINHCFYNFDYKDYYFIWIIFIKECYEHYKKNNELLNMKSYYQLIYDFSSKSNIEHVIDVLNNNNINFNDVNKILEFIINDEILIDKKPIVETVVPVIEKVVPVIEKVVPVIKDVEETVIETVVPVIKDVVEPIVIEPVVIEPVIKDFEEPVIKDVVEPVIEQVVESIVEPVITIEENVVKPVVNN